MNVGLTHISRHPINGHGREDLASVLLSAAACLPHERHLTSTRAVAHQSAKLVPGNTLVAIRTTFGHQDFGVDATVVEGGLSLLAVRGDWNEP